MRRGFHGDPVLLIQSILEASESGGGDEIGDHLRSAHTGLDLAVGKQASETIEEFPAKQHAEHLDREQEFLAGIDPRTVGAEAATGDDAMKVRVKDEIASPRVHDAGDADQRADPFRVVSECKDGFTGCFEQQVEEQDLCPGNSSGPCGLASRQ